LLRAEGYQVIEAQWGENALQQLARAEEVHVVLTDIAMPGGMTGVELAENILAAQPSRELCSRVRSGGRNGGSRPRFQRTQRTEPDS
jgi:CheY-like chemotaxis protein